MREPLVGDWRRRVSCVDSRKRKLRVLREFLAKRREEKEEPPERESREPPKIVCLWVFRKEKIKDLIKGIIMGIKGIVVTPIMRG